MLYRTDKKRKLYFDEESFEMEMEKCILMLLFVCLSPTFPNDSKLYIFRNKQRKFDQIVDLNTKKQKNMAINIGFQLPDF